jgi:NAD(P)-dependent dehydrogenase (short-subunit alcohol dehydrogenase family)
MANKVCVVIGVGPGNGAAIARRYAAGGYAVALLARRLETSSAEAAALPGAKAYACDATSADDVTRVFTAIRADLGEPEVLVYNAGSGVFADIERATPADFEGAFRVNVLGAVLASQQVIPSMKAAGRGSIVFIGATATVKGGPRSAAFSSAKAGQRGLAESMARHLWPQGIHVSIIVVDGVVDLAATRERMPNVPESFFIKPDGVAETAFQLSQQDRSAWSFEVEARPFGEKW